MAGGHKVDSQGLTQAAKALSEIPAHTLEQPLAAVKDVRVLGPDFGDGYQGQAEAYKVGVLRMAGMADAYLKASETFGDKLNASGGKYNASEQDSTQAVKRAPK